MSTAQSNLITADYPSGSQSFDPSKVGSAVVKVTDPVTKQFVFSDSDKSLLGASGYAKYGLQEIISSYERNKNNNPRVNAVVVSESIAFGGTPTAGNIGYVLSGISRTGYTFTAIAASVNNTVWPQNAGTILTKPFRLYGAAPYVSSGGLQSMSIYSRTGNGTFVGTISGTTLTVTSVITGVVGSSGGGNPLVFPGVAQSTTINNWGAGGTTGTGGVGTYQLSASNTVATPTVMTSWTRGQAGTSRLVFSTDEPKPIINCSGFTTAYLMNVNDGSGWKRVYDSTITTNPSISNQAFTGAAGSGFNDIQLDFTQVGGRKRRDIELLMFSDVTIYSVGIGNSSTYYAPPNSPTILLVADSMGGTVSQGNMKDAYSSIVQDYLGVKDFWMISEGGSGFVNTNGNLARTHLQKLQYMAQHPHMANISLGLIQPSVNDDDYTAAQVTAAALECFQYALSQFPGVLWIVGGTTAQNNTANQALSVTTETAVASAVATINSPLLVFLPTMTDPSGQAVKGTGNSGTPAGNGNADFLFNASDSTHFSVAGHNIWGSERMAPGIINAIKTAVRVI